MPHDDTTTNTPAPFVPVIRMAGSNDFEEVLEFTLGHRNGEWMFRSTQAAMPDVPESVARDLVAMFERAEAGLPAYSPVIPLPVDRDWTIETLGRTMLVRFDVFSPEHESLVAAAINMFKVHQLCVSGLMLLEGSLPAFCAVMPDGNDDDVDILIAWSEQGFVYRVERLSSPGTAESNERWPPGTTSLSLASIVHDFGLLLPAVLHPVAAWDVMGEIMVNLARPAVICRHVWLEMALHAVGTGQMITVSDHLDTLNAGLSAARRAIASQSPSPR